MASRASHRPTPMLPTYLPTYAKAVGLSTVASVGNLEERALFVRSPIRDSRGRNRGLIGLTTRGLVSGAAVGRLPGRRPSAHVESFLHRHGPMRDRWVILGFGGRLRSSRSQSSVTLLLLMGDFRALWQQSSHATSFFDPIRDSPRRVELLSFPQEVGPPPKSNYVKFAGEMAGPPGPWPSPMKPLPYRIPLFVLKPP